MQNEYELQRRRVQRRKQMKRKRKRRNIMLILLLFVIICGVKIVMNHINWNQHMVSNCGQDENGNLHGGKAGDQTKNEWDIRGWKAAGWTCVLRYPNSSVREEICSLATKAAENDLIGYNQHDRKSFWEHLQMSAYDPSQITVACNADCSCGTAGIVKAVGYRIGMETLQNINVEMTTANMREALQSVGFTVLTEKKYLNSPEYLLPGDIVLRDGVHVCINITEGSKVK